MVVMMRRRRRMLARIYSGVNVSQLFLFANNGGVK
jgi:hypothetical protein